jgi:NitT/TauT family transport system substrate-binding protein
VAGPTSRLVLLSLFACILGCASPAATPVPGSSGGGQSSVGAASAATPTPATPSAGSAATAGLPVYEPPTPLSPPLRVRLADIQSTSDGGFYLALENGYFAAEGLDVELVRFDTGATQIGALSTNQLDVGVGALSAGLLNAVARGIAVRIVADRATLRNGALSFMVRTELVESGQIVDWKDFRGRTVANNGTGTGAQLALQRGLRSGGLTFQDVDQQIISFPDMVPALGNGSIDLGVLIEPLITAAITRGVAVRWQRAIDVYPDLEISVVMYSDEFARQTEAANRFMIAYLRGVREYHDGLFKGLPNRPRVVQALVEHTAVKDPALYDRMEPSYVNPNGWVQVENLKEQQRELAELGLLDGPPVDLDQVIDLRYVENALRALGRYDE